MANRAMLQYAFACFKAQVQPIERGIAFFKLVDDAQALQIVFETARVGGKFMQAGIQLVLPGMAKRRVAQVVRQRYGFGQVFVQAQVRSEEHTSELQSLMRISYAV